MKRMLNTTLIMILLLFCQTVFAEDTEIQLGCGRYSNQYVGEVSSLDVDVYRGGDCWMLATVFLHNYDDLKWIYSGEPVWTYEYESEIDESDLPVRCYQSVDQFQISYSSQNAFPSGKSAKYILSCTWGNALKAVEINLHFKEYAMEKPQKLILEQQEMVVKVGEYFEEPVAPACSVDIENWSLDGHEAETQIVFGNDYYKHVDYEQGKYYADAPGIYSMKVIWSCANFELEAEYYLVVLDENGNRPALAVRFGYLYQPWCVYYLEGDMGESTNVQTTIENYDQLKEQHGGSPKYTLEKLSGPDAFSYVISNETNALADGNIYMSAINEPTLEGISKFCLTVEWGDSVGTQEFEISAEKLKMGLPTDVSGVTEKVEVALGGEFEIPMPQISPEGWRGNHEEYFNLTIWYDSSFAADAINILEWKEDSILVEGRIPGTHTYSIGYRLSESNLVFKKPLTIVVTNPEETLLASMVRFYYQPLMLQVGEEFNMYYRTTDSEAVFEEKWSVQGDAVAVEGNHIKAMKDGKATVYLTLKDKNNNEVTKFVDVQVGSMNVYRLPANLKTIEEEAFTRTGMNAVNRIIVGSRVESVDKMAFAYGANLNAIYFEGDMPSFADNNYFSIYFMSVIICQEDSQLHRIVEDSPYMYMTY